jgi:hypothetical protein
MLSTDLARVIIQEREREVRSAVRLRALLAACDRPERPFLQLARLPFARLAAAWSR